MSKLEEMKDIVKVIPKEKWKKTLLLLIIIFLTWLAGKFLYGWW